MDIDDEWAQFMLSGTSTPDFQPLSTSRQIGSDSTCSAPPSTTGSATGSATNSAPNSTTNSAPNSATNTHIYNNNTVDVLECPKATDIHISTKSKIAYLNTKVDLQYVFWKLGVIMYTDLKPGIVKKQMKFNSTTQEEVDVIADNIKDDYYVNEQIITSVNDPSGVKNWFKDVRKISIGISKKDIVSYRSKPKCAFYNCFVMILRIRIEDPEDEEYGLFHEFHVKIFNTGKVETPGIRSDYHLNVVLEHILMHLRPIIGADLDYNGKCDTILINSNFNCGFFIQRDALFDILKLTYNIQCIYDPCSYPGIQCKFYYDKTKSVQTGTRDHVVLDKKSPNIVVVSFMIFRTGSILVVGMCEEDVLEEVYLFIKNLLQTEFLKTCQYIPTAEEVATIAATKLKNKTVKLRKRYITVESVVESTQTLNLNTIIPDIPDIPDIHDIPDIPIPLMLPDAVTMVG
jgi:hypothetical protein